MRLHPLVAVLVTYLALNAQGSHAQGPSQAGFISIDCGATLPYTDVRGITWVTDANYTSVGTNVQSVPGALVFSNNPEYSTLRYFNEPRSKYCYVLPVEPNATYLLRATYWYGNYDRLNKPPIFNVAIDATEGLSINLTTYNEYARVQEYMGRTSLTATSMSFCLYKDPESLTVPVISSLELRPLLTLAYDQPWLYAGNFLFKFLRQNFGGVKEVRYPDDEYDRTWTPWIDRTFVGIVGDFPVTDPSQLFIKPPPAVMGTAQTSATLGNVVLPYDYGTASGLPCVLYLFFAELNSSAVSTSRTFTANVDGYGPTPINPFVQTGGAFRPTVVSWSNFSLTDTSQVTLAQTIPASDFPPLVNAAEVFAKFPIKVATTVDTDVAALEAIKVALNLTSWGGDPCLPVAHDWVTCSSASPPRVLGIKLSKYNLTGQIPVGFGKMSNLTTLWLDNNNFTGPIPDLSGMKSLQTLHLNDNYLNGSIPESLGTLPALKELFLHNNDLTGTVPASLQGNAALVIDIRGNPVCNCGGRVADASPSASSKSNVGLIAGVIGGVVAVLLLGCGVGFFCLYRKKSNNNDGKSIELPTNGQLSYGSTGGNAIPVDPSVSNQGAKPYTLAEISAATQNFKRKIGEGGFGPVYYGKLSSGKEVAVKVSDANSRQGVNEFNNEVQLLSRVHHKNLVSLVGFCQEGKSQMLVYEFLHKGTVREHLYGSKLAIEEPLDWKMRLDIAVNAAQGLEYLHSGCTPSIIHRDVKSSNILLTDRYIAKVADFGLSRLGPEEGGASHVSTMVKGTAGYLDPEYWSTNNLTEKSDVFSFGVVLLELICARQPIDNTLEDRTQWNINDKVRKYLQAGDIDSILDPALKRCHPNMDSVWKVAEVAIQSVEPKGVHRPFMRDVVKELREAIALETGFSGAYSDKSGSQQGRAPPARAHDQHGNRGSYDDFSGASIDVSMNYDQHAQAPNAR